jgi:hypothetical protein
MVECDLLIEKTLIMAKTTPRLSPAPIFAGHMTHCTVTAETTLYMPFY